MATEPSSALNSPLDGFPSRHIGPNQGDIEVMLDRLGVSSLAQLARVALPAAIHADQPLGGEVALGEAQASAALGELAAQNLVFTSLIGCGYHNCITPPVIQRNILENPAWYTHYTPYQAEIAQGRLEALLNFQTLIADLCALPVANASLLDEATAAAEAMVMCRAALRGKRDGFFVAAGCHPQTIAVVQTRAAAAGITIMTGDPASFDFGAAPAPLFGALLPYPRTDGRVVDCAPVIDRVHAAGALAVVTCDPLALTLLEPPGELGADVAVGSAQRLGVPLGYGGPHAAFLATLPKYQRQVPGRIVGVSKDQSGAPALRLAMQTREQHIRRERATSNICTAEVLLAVMASMYAIYHGPEGLRRIARRAHRLAATLAAGLRQLGFDVANDFFDTLAVAVEDPDAIMAAALARRINLRRLDDGHIGIALDETVPPEVLGVLLEVFAAAANSGGTRADVETLAANPVDALPAKLVRQSEILTHPIFNRYHCETEMLRYMRRLETKDLALNEAMTPLGSCTMKLNGTTEMLGLTLPGFAALHPFAPIAQAAGYQRLFAELASAIRDVTGLAGVSLQPNAGSQGELAGLLVIRAYHRARGDEDRNVCLIPASAHGTNPASAVMAGMRVVVVRCDADGNIDVADLRDKAATHRDALAALVVTYPSTHGVFETAIKDITAAVHEHGGQVHLDGANLSALVGLSRLADLGADVCHLNLHKTFAIPHGGGGPGMGPIACAEHLSPFLPGHPVIPTGGEQGIGAVAAAPWGSAGILPISWAYIRMMGGAGLTRATQVAILNANYMAKRLEDHYPVLYHGPGGFVAHEFIIDLRPAKDATGITVDDVAKRLMDFGFHAPTMSWPVPGTMMIEPTESESKAELDRFCDAMIAIRGELTAIERGELDAEDNPLRNAPHTAAMVSADEWTHPYPRQQGAYPAPYLRRHKFWPAVARIDNAFGDRNLVCTCPAIDADG